MLQIRKATLDDIPKVITLWKEYTELHDEKVISKSPGVAPLIERKEGASEILEKFIAKNLQEENGLVLIAEIDGEVVGYSFFYYTENKPVYKIEKIGYLADIFVREDYQGLHISSQFMDKGEKWLREKGIEYISLNVSFNNDLAYKIYKRWGYFDNQVIMSKKL